MMKNKGLGRGLNAIFESEGAKFGDGAGKMEEIALSLITPNPKQPRTDFDEDALEELADSIRTLGLIQPITVRKEDDSRYIIISGERRWRASQKAGLETVPVFIREADDRTLHEMALVENIQRQDLNAMEIAISLHRLMEECDVTQDTVAARVGKKRSTVANYLRLLSLPPEVQVALKNDLISMGHAKAIAAMPEEARIPALKKVVRKGLSVRQTEELAKRLAEGEPQRETLADDELPDNYTRLIECCSRIFGDDIKIRKGRNGGGKLTIGFSSDKDIAYFLEKLEEK
jgi:ParB family chromosome partitioning protein